LHGAKLERAELHGAKLERAELHGANLKRAKLYGANLINAELHGANLFSAELHGATLGGAKMHGADLVRAKLHGAKLRGAKLHGARLVRARLRGADFGKRISFNNADLRSLSEDNELENTWQTIFKEVTKGVPGKERKRVTRTRLKHYNKQELGSEFDGVDKPPGAIWNGKLEEKWGVPPSAEKYYEKNLIPFLMDLAGSNKYVARNIAKRVIDDDFGGKWNAHLADQLLNNEEVLKNLQDLLSTEDFQKLENLAKEDKKWWNSQWRMRTTVIRPTPYRDDKPRPIEIALDFPLLLECAGITEEFDPVSLRVVERDIEGQSREVPFAYRTEFDARKRRERSYLTWIAHPKVGQIGTVNIYFDTKERGIEAPEYDVNNLPPENLLKNPCFEDEADGLPADWSVTPSELAGLEKFTHSTGQQSLKIVVDEQTPKDVERIVTLSQKIDVRKFAGQEIVFECDLLAERATYGAPVSIELEQFREDGSQILEYAVQPRWLSIELAQGQLVQFCERGRFNPEAATVNVQVRVRCTVRNADTRELLTGPESYFTVWLDRFVLRPGERWIWPPLINLGFVEGALEDAPLNQGFEFTGQRRLAFNGASEGTLNSGEYNPNPKSVHWGLEAGTLEFWCRPSWDSDDELQHVFFHGIAYGHRLQSRLRKLNADGGNQLEFTIADAECTERTVRSSATLRAGEWYHIAATWDFLKAHLQLFVDGKKIAELGPEYVSWPSNLVAEGGDKKSKGIGIMEHDTRSLPMQAFIGGDKNWQKEHSAESVLDELRISDIARYTDNFIPSRQEFEIDTYTRALFHFENECHGIHDSDDGFMYGHLGYELPAQEQEVLLEVKKDANIERQMVPVKYHASDELFEANRAENRMAVTRPFEELPDPRFVEYRERQVEYTVNEMDDNFTIHVGGDFEPLMRSVTFQRADESSVEETLLPRWRANNNVVPFSVKNLAATLGTRAANDAEKAHEVFKYTLQTTNYYDAHYCETLPTQHRPRVSYTLLKALNIYPFDQCGPMNHMLRKLFLAVGISSSNASGTHHQFEQAFYDGSWRLFDLSSRLYWLDRDNATVLSRRGLEDDPYLKLRQGGDPNAWLRGRKSRATFGSTERPHNMDFPLKPGEQVSICWHNEGRWFEVTGDREAIPLAKIPPYFGNGAIIYEPTAEGKSTMLDNMEIEIRREGEAPAGESEAPAELSAKDSAKPASLTYRAQSPYIFSDAQVSGNYRAQAPGAIKLFLSFDEGKNWTETWNNEVNNGQINVSMLNQITARYRYWLKLEFAADDTARVTNFKVHTTFVASPLSLPGRLSLGENRISFVGGPVTTPVKTTCQWVERHQSDLGISLNSLSYYLNGDETHRNLFIATPDRGCLVSVTLQGKPFQGEVSLEGLSDGWTVKPSKQAVELADSKHAGIVKFSLLPEHVMQGEIHRFNVVVRKDQYERKIPVQLLVAEAPLISEAEHAAEIRGNVEIINLPEASGGKIMAFTGDGELRFELNSQQDDTYALWLRARWEPDSSTQLTLKLDETARRELRAQAMIGFTDWTDARRAQTKMFAHFGEQYAHWSWYRIPEVELKAGNHRLMLGAKAGAYFDTLALLPQNPVMDRAAMNLFQNWNYAPWDNPL